MEKKTIIRYVRDKKGKPFGVVVATSTTNIGWSMCCKDDKWDRNMGKDIAKKRASLGISVEDLIVDAPKVMKEALVIIWQCANKYYK